MINREELLKTKEYWFETLQNDIFRMVDEYIQKEDITQTKLAEQLGVSKGYISQVINGNFNFSLKKMIELSLALNNVPDFKFKDLGQYIQEDKQKRFEMMYKDYSIFTTKSKFVKVYSGETASSENIKTTSGAYDLNEAA